MPKLDDTKVRLAAFQWLTSQVSLFDGVLDWKTLINGFQLDGERIPLVSMQGIFKPRVLDHFPLSIRTSSRKIYNDRDGDPGYIIYNYRGDNPNFHENVKLRDAMTNKIPLIYLFGIEKGRYIPTWPAYIVEDHPSHLEFIIQFGSQTQPQEDHHIIARPIDRKYETVIQKRRVHQAEFRYHVLNAYNNSCSICRLRHPKLLDAAHIIPDSHDSGVPEVSNGLSLCKIHHSAYDNYYFGIQPSGVITVSKPILEEEDGPMLQIGLKSIHNTSINVPKKEELKPSKERLEQRYELFLTQSA